MFSPTFHVEEQYTLQFGLTSQHALTNCTEVNTEQEDIIGTERQFHTCISCNGVSVLQQHILHCTASFILIYPAMN